MIDEKLKAAILRQVRLGPALLTVATMVENDIALEKALTTAAHRHRVEQLDLTIMWTEMVLKNSQSIISHPWKSRRKT